MRVLFLDIDGVANSQSSAVMFHRFRKRNFLPSHFRPYSEEEFCPICISNLEVILETLPDLKVVISSTWRLGEALKDMKKWFCFSEIIPDRIIDATPVLKNAQRGDEISYWVRGSNTRVTRYAVLDDDSDMDMVMDNFFKTDNKIGLTLPIAHAVIAHLEHNEKTKITKGKKLCL